MSDCHDHCNAKITNPSVYQTLDELDFERGIWFAAQHGDMGRIKHLLAQRTSPDLEDSAGYTALHYAARNGHLSACKCLLSAGANINAATRCGQATPLHRAVSAGKEDVVVLLLETGANVLLVDADGKSVLHRAVESGHSHIVRLLLNLNLSLKQLKDHKGNIPRDYTTNNTDIAVLLD